MFTGLHHRDRNGAGERSRTVVSALARPHSAVEPHPQNGIPSRTLTSNLTLRTRLLCALSYGDKMVRASGNAPDPGTHLVLKQARYKPRVAGTDFLRANSLGRSWMTPSRAANCRCCDQKSLSGSKTLLFRPARSHLSFSCVKDLGVGGW